MRDNKPILVYKVIQITDLGTLFLKYDFVTVFMNKRF